MKWADVRGLLEPDYKQKAKAAKNKKADAPPPEANAIMDDRRTDLENAEILIKGHGEDVRHIHLWKRWTIWDSKHWKPDEDGGILRLAASVPRFHYQRAANLIMEAKDMDGDARTESLKEAGEILKWAKASESRPRLEALEALARNLEGVPVRPDALDQDPWLLNVLNGTLNLRTGELRPHRREDYITKLCPHPFDPAAACPRFEKFMLEIMNANPDAERNERAEALAAFLQRAIGYSLTGSTRERCLFILWGSGKNGKSVLLQTVRTMLGEDFACKTAIETFLARKGDKIPNDIAALRGTRFVYTAEIPEGRALNESLVKDLTGQEAVQARFLFAEFFNYFPQYKIWCGTNHKPVINGTDDAIWDRVNLIPFAHRFDDDEADPELPAKLAQEMPGILAWAVRGCLAWQREGLNTPDEVNAATAEFRSEMDIVGRFLSEACIESPNCKTAGPDLYRGYVRWSADASELAVASRTFGDRLRGRRFRQERSHGKDFWLGIGLIRFTESGPETADRTESRRRDG